ncbi:hypothetical protein GCM10009854_37850 [Saccharopolyspora halophila]|uniref:Uncharacterized protein n=1 Tax=Saccharopolyspora halophila TaxID=405551 RepID=A0ABP5TM55_9PSEU
MRSSERPRELPLDDVRPCELVLTSTLSSVGSTAPPHPLSPVEGVNAEGIRCCFTPRSGADTSAAAVTNQDIDRWTVGSMESFTSTE